MINYTKQWDTQLTWYSPSAIRCTCFSSLDHGFHDFRPTYLACLSTLLKPEQNFFSILSLLGSTVASRFAEQIFLIVSKTLWPSSNWWSIRTRKFSKITLQILFLLLLWPRKGSLMKTQTRILDNRLYYTRKIELHRKGKKSRTVWITPILICLLAAKSLLLITVRRVHYGKMGKFPTTPLSKPFTS